MKKHSLFALTCLALTLGLVGCQSDDSKATPQQVKDFQGGPMPADFSKKLADEQAAGKTQADNKAPGQPSGN